MISHGVTTGALFLLVGVIYERTHDRLIAHMGGLNGSCRSYAAIFGLFTFASIGLPGLSGFIGEFLVLLGTFQYGLAAGVTTAGRDPQRRLHAVDVPARLLHRAIGWMRRFWPSLKDMTRLEWAAVAPLVVLVVALGVFPGPVLH